MNRRSAKTAQIIQSSLAQTLSKFRKGNKLYTVTNIQMSPDLKVANIWISNLGNENWNVDNIKQFIPELVEGLKKTQLKYIPKLRFQKDKSGPYNEKIDKIFKQIDES
ncbi:MAG: ribosome-binding factor A [bacterium]